MQEYTLKDPATTRSYTFDRSALLAPPPTKIIASTWEVPTDLTKVSDAFTDTTTTIVLSGGQVSTDYLIYNNFTADDQQTYREVFPLRVVDAAFIPPPPSQLEQELSALRVALGQKAAKDTWEYQIANRMKREHLFADLLKWEERLTQLVNQERRAAGGPGFFKNHYVRPVVPGG